jgi:hypothetical protein
VKLRTEIIEGELTYTPKGVYHDAMVAHALVMAMSEVAGDRFDTTAKILKRAAEIMREWGLGEDLHG